MPAIVPTSVAAMADLDPYRALARTFPGGAVLVVDPDLRLRFADGSYLSTLARRGAATVGRPLGDALGVELCQILEPLCRRALAGEDAGVEHPHADRVFSCRATPIPKQGQVTAVLLVMQDVTAQRRTEEALRRSDARYRSLIAATGGFVWRNSTDGRRPVFISPDDPSGAEGRGGTVEEWLDRIHPGDREALVQAWGAAIRNRAPLQVEHRARVSGGTYRHFIARGVPVLDEQGEVVEWVGTSQDVTEQKLAEEGARYVLEHARCLLWHAYVDGPEAPGGPYRWEMQVFDEAGARRFLPLELQHGERYADALYRHKPREDRLRIDRNAQAAFEAGARFYRQEYRCLRADGEMRWLSEEAHLEQVSEHRWRAVGVCTDITERKRAEEALRENEERLRLALDAGETGVWDWDIVQNQVAWSDRLYVFHGLEPETFGGTVEEFEALIHPADRQRVAAALHTSLEAAAPYQLEFRAVRPDGVVRWLSTTGRVLRDAAGRPVRMLGATIDITARRLIEDALRESEDRFRGTFEQAAVGIAHTRPDGCLLRVNGKFCEILGYSREELVGLTFAQITHPDDLDRNVDLLERLKRGEIETYVLEKRYLRKDGSPVWAQLTVSPNRPGPELPDYLIAVVEEISARKEADARLQATAESLDVANARLRVLNAASRAFAELGEDYGALLRAVVRRAAELLGDTCSIRLVSGDGQRLENVATYHHDPEVEAFIREVEKVSPQGANQGFSGRVFQSGEPLLLPEISREDACAAMKPEYRIIAERLGMNSVVAVPLRGQHGPAGVLFMARHDPPGRPYTPDDLRLLQELADRAALAIEKGRLLQQLRETDRRKDEFLAMLAHELRNPLAPILNAAQILRLRGPEDPYLGRQREIIERQTRHLSRLVDDLLEVSRINEGKIELRRDRVGLASIVEQAVNGCRPFVEQHHHTLSVSIPLEAVFVDVDATRLVQVLTNLLNNAAKYTDAGGQISVVAARQQDEAVVRVKDTGRGIDPELLPHVFDLFVQGERSLARTEGGLGIGLTLARRLVELHGGTISVHSEGAGKGSEFTIRLPAEPPPIRGEGRRRVRTRAVAARCRVLVVEDNVDAAETLSDLLEFWGHQVTIVHGGEQALAAAAEFRPDWVLLDIGLPGIDGYEVARRLREGDLLRGARVVALTGYGQDEDRRRSKQAGFDAHLTKPVDPEALRDLLAGPAPA